MFNKKHYIYLTRAVYESMETCWSIDKPIAYSSFCHLEFVGLDDNHVISCNCSGKINTFNLKIAEVVMCYVITWLHSHFRKLSFQTSQLFV